MKVASNYYYIQFGLFISILFLTLSCNTPTETTETEQETIFADFYIRYFQTEQQLKGQVTFGKGDTISSTTPLEMKRVNFMNSGMTKKNLLGKFTRYMYQTPTTETLAKFNFNYTDQAGKEHEQILNMEPINSFTFEKGISKANGMTLKMEGGNLTEEERIILLFNDENNRVTTLEVGGPSTNNAIQFHGGQLNELSLGKNEVYLVKKQHHRYEKENYKITNIIEFYSNTMEVDVIE